MEMECDKNDVSGQQPKYEVRISNKLGRYMVASRDLKAGEVLISECPLAVGPTCDSPLLCFACHTPLAGKFSCCATCARAPVCGGRVCQHSEEGSWHDEAECALFASSPRLTAIDLVNNVAALLPLRCMLKRSSDPRGWQQLMMMEHHLNERRDTDIWRFHQSTVQLIESLGLVSADDDCDLVQRVCGILDVNSFEVRGPLTSTSNSLPRLMMRGVYPAAALMAHHCRGNTHLAVGSQAQRHAQAHNSAQTLTVRAAEFIPRGGIIYYNYVDPLEGTTRRQERLRIGKYFTCECTRCLDPTELSTDLSSVLCPVSNCCGLLIPPKFPNPSKHIHTKNIPCHLNNDIQTICADNQHDPSDLTEIDSEVGRHLNNVKINKLESDLCDTKLDDWQEHSANGTNGTSIDVGEVSSAKRNLNNDKIDKLESELRDTKLDVSKEHNGNGTNGTSVDVGEVQNGHSASGVEEYEEAVKYWGCGECGEKVQRNAVESKVEACLRKLDSIDKSSEEELSEYVDKVSLILSPSHYLVLSAQQALAAALRERIQRETRPTVRLLRQYIQLCRQLLQVLDTLQPDISRAKAITMYEYQAASVMLARKLFEAREMTADVYMEALLGAQELLKRSTGMLVLEPSASPEGALCARALQELRDLRAATQALADATATRQHHTLT